LHNDSRWEEISVHRFLLGYNVEASRWSRPGVAVRFLQAAVKLHKELALPCTFFVRGQAIEEYPDEFRRARDEFGDLGDFQQYTYSALPLKTVCQESHRGVSVFHGGALRHCRDDIARASDVMERVLGSRPTGLGGPLGYHRGLSDRPDLLEIVSLLGIRFTRTCTRNARDWSPLAFETQPYRYSAQGFPGVLEVPGQGWPDWALKDSIGHANADGYIRHMCKDLDYVAARKLTWSCVQHDWSAIETDPDLRATRAILEHARKLDFKVQTHRAFSDEFPPQ
jgi:peptidoglycan/xylan/chitin deacetylase (PgdA/CDA1 family)